MCAKQYSLFISRSSGTSTQTSPDESSKSAQSSCARYVDSHWLKVFLYFSMNSTFKWVDFGCDWFWTYNYISIFSVFSSLRSQSFFEDMKYSDTTLVCDQREFRYHANLLNYNEKLNSEIWPFKIWEHLKSWLFKDLISNGPVFKGLGYTFTSSYSPSNSKPRYFCADF